MINEPPTIVTDLESLLASEHRFSTVYADPPWSYKNKSARGAADNHYPTLTLEKICDQPIARRVNNDAHLHLWTTNGFLREAFLVIEAWGTIGACHTNFCCLASAGVYRLLTKLVKAGFCTGAQNIVVSRSQLAN